ncbi:MAG: HYR domain-containing protein [Mariprofundus sp.]|nr:HYR domain-containing protein [Mariprofundus sp.]
MQLLAATTPTSNTVASQLVTQFLGATSNIVVEPAVPAPALNPGVVLNQTGTLNSADLGLITVAPQATPLTPVIMGKQGIILTNGHMGGTSTALTTGGDADIATALTATTGTFDAAALSFTFSVTGAQTAVTFDLVFASNEPIGGATPDAAVVMVDGINYATLNNGGILSNQTAGILIATPVPNQVVTGFNSASQVFTVTAPLIGVGPHTFKIAIADNVDRLRDSAVIVANLNATTSAQGGMGVKGTDFFPPIITLDPAVGAVVTQEATALLTPVNLGAHTVTDNFAPVPQAIPAPAGPYAVGARVVTWTATDAAGNVGTATQTVTVTDTTPPVIIPPLLTIPGGTENVFSTATPTYQADITAYLATVTATDLGAPLAAAITNNAPPAGFPIGTTTVTFNVSDASLNAAIPVTRDIIVTSTTVQPQPLGINLVNRLLLGSNITPPATATLTTYGASQTAEIIATNLGVLIAGAPPVTAVSLSLPQTGIMLSTGNTLGTGNSLTVPAAGADADVSNALIANPSFTTGGTFDAASLAFTFTVPAGTTSLSFDVIYATNEAIGGVAFPDAAVVMIDGTNRAVFNNGSLLSNLNVAFLTATNGALVPGFTNVSQVQTLTATIAPTVGNTHTIKISIADNNDALIDSAIIIGNMKASSIVNQSGMGVGDVFPPIVVAPANVIIEATGTLTSANLGAPVVTDNVDQNPRAIASSLGPYPLGITTVTWLSTDQAGNISAPVTSTVTVNDTTPPQLVAPALNTFPASSAAGLPGTNTALASYLATVTATDAVGIKSITNNAPAQFPVGTTTVTFTATDLFGNISTATTNITVSAFVAGPGAGGGIGPVPVANGIDQIPPVIKLVGNKNVTVLQTPAVALYVDPGATVIDNFDGLTPGVILATPTIDTSIVGRTVLTYSATDLAGNNATAIRTVDVVAAIAGVDVLPPVATPPADILVASTSFAGIARTSPALTAFFAAATAVDNIALAGAITNNAPAVLPVGKTIVTFTARDAQGNIGTAEAVVSVSGLAQNPGAATDFDADGMPDAWEIAVFGDPLLAIAGPGTDFDLDGLTDALERILGTNPKVPNTNASGAINDLKDAVYLNNPSDSDGDSIIDILEDNSSALDPTVVTGIPAVSGITNFTIQGNGNAIRSVAVNQIGSAPVNVINSYGLLSYQVITTVGGTATIQIQSVLSFGTNAQFYKVDAAGNYTLIPASIVRATGANSITLTLTDGGRFDLDGIANGVIVDPIAFGTAPAVLGANGGAPGGGGCTLQPHASFDPLLPLLFTIILLFHFMRRKQNM